VRWVEPDIRDDVVGFIDHWHSRSGLPYCWFLTRIGLARGRLADWRRRAGLPNRHNGKMPRDRWLSHDEGGAIIDFYTDHREDGYRRCAYMMIDRDIAFAAPSTVYRVLKRAGAMRTRGDVRTKKGTGFVQPLTPHEQWHTDISYVKIKSRFYFLICVLDGYSRMILHWDLREAMEAKDVAIVQQAARERYPDAKPRYITDNGKQFTGREFQRFIALHGLTHVTTSPYYPQSNGKLERFHGTIKRECIRRNALTDLDHAKSVIEPYIAYYNHERLHSAIGYVTPADKMAGRAEQIQEQRDQKLKNARLRRSKRNQTTNAADNQAA
jgi:transposase InsO family protein